jgi:hypothetical protein
MKVDLLLWERMQLPGKYLDPKEMVETGEY